MKEKKRIIISSIMAGCLFINTAYATRSEQTSFESKSGIIDFAYVLSIDGNDVKYFSTYEDAQKTTEIILNKYIIPSSVTSFVENIDIKRKFVSGVTLSTPYHASEELIKNNQISVKTRVGSVYHTEKQYETIKEPDNNICIGSSKLIQNGVCGEYTVSAIKEYINGVETSHEIISCITTVEPINEIIKTGTNPNPDVGCGTFITPVSGRITSKFGSRWGRNHNGIDIGAPTGTPIYASDNGRVCFSGTKGSFGKLVKINHNNGYTTYYAHCSKLLVSENEIVKQGQLIAYVGNTGNSTGPHCHFEIRKSDVPNNPLNFIS